MRVASSLKTLKKRHKECRVVRRKGRVYVINKRNPRFKARQGWLRPDTKSEAALSSAVFFWPRADDINLPTSYGLTETRSGSAHIAGTSPGL